jgi:hypothetical protein
LRKREACSRGRIRPLTTREPLCGPLEPEDSRHELGLALALGRLPMAVALGGDVDARMT